MRTLVIFLLVCALEESAAGQSIDTVLFTEVGRYQHGYVAFPDGFSASTFGSRIDRLGRPYLFMACGDSGMMVLDISDPGAPIVADRVLPGEVGGLRVMNLEQEDTLLYLCLGDLQSGAESAGLAVLSVADAASPVILDTWNGGTTYAEGCAIVRVNGTHAYLGAMESGVIVLDVGDPTDIQFVSAYQPDPSWPGIAGYDPQARGMALSGNALFLAYDAGGLRAIDIGDPTAPVQIGQYVNPALPLFTPPAYNNLVVLGDRAYVAVDYCGLEVIDVSDPTDMEQVEWMNPWNCFGLSWVGSDGHSNELIATMGDSLLLMSGADSEVLALDITDADHPVLKGGYIHPNDSACTWGLDAFGDLVAANFINNHGAPGLQPYDSKFGGMVLFQREVDLATSVAAGAGAPPLIRPNPTTGAITVQCPAAWNGQGLTITDAMGRTCMVAPAKAGPFCTVDLSALDPGNYFLSFDGDARDRAPARVVVVR